MTTETTDRNRIESAYERLDQAAQLAEGACESLSAVEGLADNWERIRALVFALRDERDRLAAVLECSLATVQCQAHSLGRPGDSAASMSDESPTDGSRIEGSTRAFCVLNARSLAISASIASRFR